MIREGRDFTADETLRADVVIVGSGCGGATVARALAERGRDVLIVERGGYYTREDFDQREANMLAKIDGGRGLDTSDDGAVALTYGNNVGGASVHYWADSYRTPPDRLALWEEAHGLQGHDLATLEPHFARIEADLNVHQADDSYANGMNVRFRDAARRLGWEPRRVPQARKLCVRSGFCMQGCSYDAKQSQLVTHIPAALADGARLLADVEAHRLTFDGARCAGLQARVLDRGTGRPAGPRLTIEADAVVVAAGGYGTPRFLLRQALPRPLPHLGQHMFCNPCPMVHARFAEPIEQWRNIPACWGVERFRLAAFDDRGDYVEGGYLLMPNQLQPAVLAAVLPGFGADHRGLMRDLPRLGGTIAWIDDADEARMWLDGDRVRLHVPLDGANAPRLRDAWRKQAELLFEAGARELIFGDAADTRLADRTGVDAAVRALDLRPNRNVFAAPHPGGGARMGADPASSVVGFDHRVHGTDNLYVADPSVLPTAPSVDPSVTIMAFAYVAADAIHQELG